MTRCAAVLVAIATLAAPAAVAAAPDILPIDEIRPGMTGTGRTVFAGDRIVEFDVEILAVLRDVAPDQDMILARCSGGPLAGTRILSGMSGSPVFVDGRLIGAVAFSWGFSTEPIAGITPIEAMLEVAGRNSAVRSPAANARDLPDLAPLARPDRLAAFFEARRAALAGPAPPAGRADTPITVAGLVPEGFAAVAPWLRDAGFAPVQGAASATAAAGDGTLAPGSPVGVQLTRGDIEMTATGTVTWVDGDRVLAFGHPLFGLGDVDLPMTSARVDALLPSLVQSSRVATSTGEVGSLRQDRAAAVAGRLGAHATMIPVRVQYDDGAGGRRTFRFEVASDPLLAPLLVYVSLNGMLAARDRSFGDATVRIAEGSVVKLEGQDEVALHNLFAGPEAVPYATGTTAYILHLLMNNAWRPPRVEGINLILEYRAEPRAAMVHRVTVDRYRARPGDTVRVSVALRPYRGEDVVVQRDVRIPPDTPAGTLRLAVGGAIAISRPEPGQEPLLPADLEQFVWLINRLRRNDRVFVVATREDEGVFLEGARLPNLPPSKASVLTRPASRGNLTLVRERGVLEEEIPTDYAVEGLARIELQVVAP